MNIDLTPVEDQVNAAEAEPGDSVPFWAAFAEQFHALRGDVFDRLPKDGASEHDHYLYGAPKRGA